MDDMATYISSINIIAEIWSPLSFTDSKRHIITRQHCLAEGTVDHDVMLSFHNFIGYIKIRTYLFRVHLHLPLIMSLIVLIMFCNSLTHSRSLAHSLHSLRILPQGRGYSMSNNIGLSGYDQVALFTDDGQPLSQYTVHVDIYCYLKHYKKLKICFSF